MLSFSLDVSPKKFSLIVRATLDPLPSKYFGHVSPLINQKTTKDMASKFSALRVVITHNLSSHYQVEGPTTQ